MCRNNNNYYFNIYIYFFVVHTVLRLSRRGIPFESIYVGVNCSLLSIWGIVVVMFESLKSSTIACVNSSTLCFTGSTIGRNRLHNGEFIVLLWGCTVELWVFNASDDVSSKRLLRFCLIMGGYITLGGPIGKISIGGPNIGATLVSIGGVISGNYVVGAVSVIVVDPITVVFSVS